MSRCLFQPGFHKHIMGYGFTCNHLMSISSPFLQHPMMGNSMFGDDLTARALEKCKKTVLHPYLVFLKVVRPYL